MNKYTHLAPPKTQKRMPHKSWARCLGKRSYFDEEEASKRAKKDLKEYGAELEPYRCPHCLQYHLRSKKRKK